MRCVALAALVMALSLFVFADTAADNHIRDQVMIKLAEDPDVKGGALNVDVSGGVVTLKGKVETGKQKSKATRVAKKVKGVTSVDNELVVSPR